MKIRTQLIVAFLLLAIVPLAGIVLYSYFSSLAAVRRAYEAEDKALIADMDARLDAVTADLRQRIAKLGELPFGTLLAAPADRAPAASPFFGQLISEMGDAAPLVDSIEFVPLAGEAALVPEPEPPVPAPPPPLAEGAEVPAPPAPATAPVVGSLVIDLSGILAGLDEEQLAAAWVRLNREEMVAAERGEAAAVDAIAVGFEVAETALSALGEGLEVRFDEDGSGKVEIRWQEQEAAESDELADEFLRHLRLGDAFEALALAREEAERRALAWEEARRRLALAKLKRQRTALALADGLDVKVREKGGKLIGEVKTTVSQEGVVARVLRTTPRSPGEIPFAFCPVGGIYTRQEADRERLAAAGLREYLTAPGAPSRFRDGWAVATREDEETGVTFGIARPISESLEEIRRTAIRNFGWGLGLVGLALLGILPLSSRITRDLERVTAGARRIARGDLRTRVPVRSKSEIGQLALAFNQMAEDLSRHQQRLCEEESRRREQEVQQRLLEAEYQRKSAELEDARSFQLALLPKELPQHPRFAIAVDMATATEVGGDYYDFRLDRPGADGTLTIAIGDATGHGARAGTMVTVVKSLFSSCPASVRPSEFLIEAAATVRRMDLERMAMALSLVQLRESTLTVSAAGMPPVLVFRPESGEVEEVAVAGMPLGGLPYSYEEEAVELAAGDTVLLMTDGFPELLNPQGDPLGYPQARELFAAAAGGTPPQIIAALTSAARVWTAGQPPQDDVTFVAVRVLD